MATRVIPPAYGRLRYRPIRLLDVVGTSGTAGTVVTDVAGLWTVNVPALSNPQWIIPRPFDATWGVDGPTVVSMTDLTPPAAAQDIEIAIGGTYDAVGWPTRGFRSGLRYPAGTVNIAPFVHIPAGVVKAVGIAELAASISRVWGCISGNAYAGSVTSSIANRTGSVYRDIARGAAQACVDLYVVVSVQNGAGNAQTVKFRPKFAYYYNSNIPG